MEKCCLVKVFKFIMGKMYTVVFFSIFTYIVYLKFESNLSIAVNYRYMFEYNVIQLT